MPDKDYSKGKIYRIWCITGESDDVYVGSTIQSLAKRWGGHKTASRKEKCQRIRLYQTIAGNWDAWKIELIELCPCLSRMELERREGEVIRLTGTLNETIAGRTPKERREENVETVKEYQKAYYQQNAEVLKQYQMAYRQQNTDAKKGKNKAYYQQNAEVFKEKRKAYYQENNEAINEKQRQRYQEKKAEAQAQ